MKSTYVDENGDVRCPVCGARNSFTVKRTGKAKWAAGLTVGVGALVTPKRLKCNGCGANLKRAGADAPRTPPRSTGFESEAPQTKPNEPGIPPTTPVAELVQLAELHAQGALTDDEFAAAKARMLGTAGQSSQEIERRTVVNPPVAKRGGGKIRGYGSG